MADSQEALACYFRMTLIDRQWVPTKHNVYGSWWEPLEQARSGPLSRDGPPDCWGWRQDPAASECGWLVPLCSREDLPSQLKPWSSTASWKSPSASPEGTFLVVESRATRPASPLLCIQIALDPLQSRKTLGVYRTPPCGTLAPQRLLATFLMPATHLLNFSDAAFCFWTCFCPCGLNLCSSLLPPVMG